MPNFTILGVSHGALFLEMTKTWSTHGPSSWFFLNLNQCAQGCSMPNFGVLASILTDIFNFLLEKERKGERKKERKEKESE